MKIFLVHAKKWLGPNTPYTGLVKEESELKAIEAFMDPRLSPFEPDQRLFFSWFDRYHPTPEDFIAKCVGFENIWPESFSADLRDPEKNSGPIFSSDETVCRLFMKDRVVMRQYTDGSWVATLIFTWRLALADFFYSLYVSVGDVQNSSKNKVKDINEVK